MESLGTNIILLTVERGRVRAASNFDSDIGGIADELG